jgi:WD40 repeat protein
VEQTAIFDDLFDDPNLKFSPEPNPSRLTPPLRVLATDCLRLSMHFFYPVQQCAQHVYHTALPLSPTLSQLHESWLQGVTNNQLPRVTAFLGAPKKWGLLLRTIDVRPKRLACTATSSQMIVAACEEIVNIYDAVTFVLRQSLNTPEIVTKIQCSPDGSTLFFVHTLSVTVWDVQTGGLTHTFATPSEVTDVAVSTTGNYIACGSSDGSVVFWNIHTKAEGEVFGSGQPVVAICWLSSDKLAVATQTTVCIYEIARGTSKKIHIPGCVWGMANVGGEPLVGTSLPGQGAGQKLFFIRAESERWHELKPPMTRPSLYLNGLLSPTLVGNKVVCITPPSGVQSFDTERYDLLNNPPLLDSAMLVAVSLNRNLVVQTKDSLQIFALDVLTSSDVRSDVHTSHVYPLGEKHIICLLQPNRHLTLLELETLQELHPDDNASPLGLPLTNQPPSARVSSSRGFVAEFGASAVMHAWRSGTPLPEWIEAVEQDPPLGGLSPEGTLIVTIYGSPLQELRVKDAKAGTVLAKLPLEHNDLGTGKVYDVTFDSETRFNLKIDGPGWHIQVPHDITAPRWGRRSHTITKGEPVPLTEPRTTPPYTLDANCEWVVDAKSRKICWISPGDVRRGDGGHFWAGLELVMVGDDGVVRKVSFKEPDC